MKDLKFRVWNGTEMVYDVTVGKFGAFYVNPGDKGNGLDPNDSASLTPFTTKYSGTAPVMQSAGLKDKNGTAIFEGDVIQTIGSENTKIKHEIIFEDGSFCAKNLAYQNIGKLTQKWITELDFEVIGNIYEHKHPSHETI